MNLDYDRWLTHFRRNRDSRPEPEWNAPLTLSPEVVRPLVRSLEQFHLGDGGGPACLIAWNAEQFRASGEGTRELVDLWFAEEKEHSRLLKGAVARFGGHPISGHWSFTAFCWSRRWFGVRFELTVLLLTEIVSTAYYRMMRRHGGDPALRAMCRLILRDEAGHVTFHRDRLARAARAKRAGYGKLWELRFRALGLAAGTMLWANHAPALQALGGSRAEFYREVWLELSRFMRHLRSESLCDVRPTLPRAAYRELHIGGSLTMKTKWFKRIGWFHVPASLPGVIVTCLAVLFCGQVFVAIDRHSHSASDTLYSVFPFAVCTFLLLDWIAARTSDPAP